LDVIIRKAAGQGQQTPDKPKLVMDHEMAPNGPLPDGHQSTGFKIRRNSMSEWEPKIVSFLCNWCSYGAADLAGVSRMEYPPNIRVVRIPCTGRMSPKFALAALREGADAVWVSG
jgi:hypothetical protein